MSETKKCSACGYEKELDQFKAKGRGFSKACISCSGKKTEKPASRSDVGMAELAGALTEVRDFVERIQPLLEPLGLMVVVKKKRGGE